MCLVLVRTVIAIIFSGKPFIDVGAFDGDVIGLGFKRKELDGVLKAVWRDGRDAYEYPEFWEKPPETYPPGHDCGVVQFHINNKSKLILQPCDSMLHGVICYLRRKLVIFYF